MDRFASILGEFIDVPVKIRFYVGEGAAAVRDEERLTYIGKIKKVSDEVLVFEHQEIEAKRQEIKGEEFLHLSHIWIWSVSPLADNYANHVVVKCMHCGKEQALTNMENTEYK